MPEKITAYKCIYCTELRRNIYESRSGCRKHEARCWLNPARKSCATCANLSEGVEQGEPLWVCRERKDVKPFKQKIENCPHWEESGAIFTNEDALWNRPVERMEAQGE